MGNSHTITSDFLSAKCKIVYSYMQNYIYIYIWNRLRSLSGNWVSQSSAQRGYARSAAATLTLDHKVLRTQLLGAPSLSQQPVLLPLEVNVSLCFPKLMMPVANLLSLLKTGSPTLGAPVTTSDDSSARLRVSSLGGLGASPPRGERRPPRDLQWPSGYGGGGTPGLGRTARQRALL